MLELLKDFIHIIPIAVLVSIVFVVGIYINDFLQDTDNPFFKLIYSVLKVLLIIVLLICLIITLFNPNKREYANQAETTICVIENNKY
jgi:cbb3-type cytochrome oxidase subunit 3